LTGDARIGRVTFSKTGRTIFYRDQVFRRIIGGGFKSNYCDEATGEEYWISGAKKKGGDRLYGERLPVVVDDDVREEYWTSIRGMPERISVFAAQTGRDAPQSGLVRRLRWTPKFRPVAKL